MSPALGVSSASARNLTFPLACRKYREYKFIYNDTYAFLTDSQSTRYSTGGFESLLFDIYFLSHADYLVCTFSSNICRLAYELSVPGSDDQAKTAHSLDTPYYVLSDALFHKMAVLERHKEPKVRRRGRAPSRAWHEVRRVQPGRLLPFGPHRARRNAQGVSFLPVQELLLLNKGEHFFFETLILFCQSSFSFALKHCHDALITEAIRSARPASVIKYLAFTQVSEMRHSECGP